MSIFNSPKIHHKKFRAKIRNNKAWEKDLKKRRKALERTARRLRWNPPRSEVWFKKLYAKHQHALDKFNEILDIYIPDIQNKKYLYVIEVDGSFHESPVRMAKDLKKDKYLQAKGYTVFRVTAYNDAQALQVIEDVVRLRNAGPVLDDNTAAGAPSEKRSPK